MVSSMGEYNISMQKLNIALVRNTRHFDDEIDLAGSEGLEGVPRSHGDQAASTFMHSPVQSVSCAQISSDLRRKCNDEACRSRQFNLLAGSEGRFRKLLQEASYFFWRELDLMTFLIIVIPLSVFAHADTVTVSLWLGKMWKTTQCSPADSDIETTASVIHGILA